MSYKTKSFLYFASFVIAIASCYAIEQSDAAKSSEIAHHTTEIVSPQEALN